MHNLSSRDGVAGEGVNAYLSSGTSREIAVRLHGLPLEAQRVICPEPWLSASISASDNADTRLLLHVADAGAPVGVFEATINIVSGDSPEVPIKLTGRLLPAVRK